MTDKSRDGGSNKAHDRGATRDQIGSKPGARTEGTRSPTDGSEEGDARTSHSGLDVSGQFRIGERITLGVRGGDLVLMQSHSGREVVVSEAALAGLLDDTYFVDKVD